MEGNELVDEILHNGKKEFKRKILSENLTVDN